jgi:hypothetical protein
MNRDKHGFFDKKIGTKKWENDATAFRVDGIPRC